MPPVRGAGRARSRPGDSMPLVECRRSWLYSSMQPATARRAWPGCAKWCSAEQLELQGGVERLRGRVIQRRPGAAHRLGHPGVACTPWRTAARCTPRPGRCGRSPRRTSPPRTAIAMHNAARASSASWWASIANPTQPAGVQVQHAGQIELALVVGDLGQVPDPDLVRPVPQGEVPPDQVRRLPRGAVRAGA